MFAFKYFIFFTLFLISDRCLSGNIDSLEKIKIRALPSAFYTPETRLGFGGLIYSYFKIGKFDSITKKSNTQTYLSYTLRNQFVFENDYQIWLKKNIYYLTGSAFYSRFPIYFYGIGNETKENDKVMISFDVKGFQTKIFKKISKNVYAGVFFHYHKVFNQSINLVSNSECGNIYGNNGFTAKGIGPVLMLDKRDNPLNPSKGSYLIVSYVDFKSIVVNRNKFSSLIIDARKYFTFYKKIVWNGNIYFVYNKGEVPYLMLPEIGGARFLRGYYRGRFRDKNMIIIQQEFRMMVYKNFGCAVFGGIGEVSKTLSQLKTGQIHYDYGFGLRFRVNKKENTNIRFDYGFTKNTKGLYVVFAEAF